MYLQLVCSPYQTMPFSCFHAPSRVGSLSAPERMRACPPGLCLDGRMVGRIGVDGSRGGCSATWSVLEVTNRRSVHIARRVGRPALRLTPPSAQSPPKTHQSA